MTRREWVLKHLPGVSAGVVTTFAAFGVVVAAKAAVEVAVNPNSINWNTIILAVIGLLMAIATPVGLAMAAKINTRMAEASTAAKQTAIDTAATKVATIEAAKTLEKVEGTVNSGRTTMENFIKQLQDDKRDLAEEIAMLREKAKGKEVAATLADKNLAVADAVKEQRAISDRAVRSPALADPPAKPVAVVDVAALADRVRQLEEKEKP